MQSMSPVKEYRDYLLQSMYCPGDENPLENVYLIPADELQKAKKLGLKPYREGNS